MRVEQVKLSSLLLVPVSLNDLFLSETSKNNVATFHSLCFLRLKRLLKAYIGCYKWVISVMGVFYSWI